MKNLYFLLSLLLCACFLQATAASFNFSSTPPAKLPAKLDQVITFAADAGKTYGDDDFDPGATSSNSTIPITYTSSDPSIAKILNDKIRIGKIGIVTITASQAGNSTYNPAVSVSQTLVVLPAILTITADSKSKVYGTANPVLTYSYSGFVKGECPLCLGTKPNISTTTKQDSPVGGYPITLSGGSADNYTLVYVNSILTITPAKQTITFKPIPDQYEGDPDYNLGATASSGLPVSYTSSNPNVATIVDGKLRIVGPGTSCITATQEGNENYLAAEPVCQTVKVIFFPDAVVNADEPLSFCQGLGVNLKTVTASSFQWFKDGQPISSQTKSALMVNQSGKYHVELTFSNGLKKTSTITTVNVFQTFSANITAAGSTTISKGESLQLQATGGELYSWQPTLGLSNSNIANPVARPAQTTTYKVTVTNANGCSSSEQITIQVLEDYKFDANNVITPNGDGFNDKWEIKNIDYYPDNEVKVYDRNGKLMYSKKGYKNDWDGTYNGSPLAEDTYYYYVDFGPGYGILKGYVSIVRDHK
ncbi:MAG TPA: MBG domain-containing protein [Daejeonella sp.]|nr:MBG domain-containing protein [Daejeonella sp.]